MPKTYTTSQGDTWDIISLKMYGSEKFVDVLIEDNWREQSRVLFPSGVVLSIPEIAQTTKDSRNLPPWRR
ncbi:MAG: tail protein X [Methyloprofundus sp.]|nr:tail protein X [Methyloprofundus sp.]